MNNDKEKLIKEVYEKVKDVQLRDKIIKEIANDDNNINKTDKNTENADLNVSVSIPKKTIKYGIYAYISIAIVAAVVIISMIYHQDKEFRKEFDNFFILDKQKTTKMSKKNDKSISFEQQLDEFAKKNNIKITPYEREYYLTYVKKYKYIDPASFIYTKRLFEAFNDEIDKKIIKSNSKSIKKLKKIRDQLDEKYINLIWKYVPSWGARLLAVGNIMYHKVFCDEKKIKKDSMCLARTVAWNHVFNIFREDLSRLWGNWGDFNTEVERTIFFIKNEKLKDKIINDICKEANQFFCDILVTDDFMIKMTKFKVKSMEDIQFLRKKYIDKVSKTSKFPLLYELYSNCLMNSKHNEKIRKWCADELELIKLKYNYDGITHPCRMTSVCEREDLGGYCYRYEELCKGGGMLYPSLIREVEQMSKK